MRQKTGMQTGPSEGVGRFTPGPGGHHTLLAHRVSINQLAELGRTSKAQFLLFHPIPAFPPQERVSASPSQHRQLRHLFMGNKDPQADHALQKTPCTFLSSCSPKNQTFCEGQGWDTGARAQPRLLHASQPGPGALPACSRSRSKASPASGCPPGRRSTRSRNPAG